MMHVIQSHAYTIISKYQTFETPIWVYIVSVIGGILTLILITYALYKVSILLKAKREKERQFDFCFVFSSAFSVVKRRKN